jgi:ComEC/Rec2-related protein
MYKGIQFFKRTARSFPLFADWLRLPGLVGWIGLSAGIVAGYYVLRTQHFASILYNAVLIAAIILSLCGGILLKRPRTRFAAFFVAGAAAAGLSLVHQCIEFSAARPFLSGTEHSYLTGTVLSSPVLSSGAFVFPVRCDSVFSGTQQGVLRNKVLDCRSGKEPCFAGRVTLSGRYVPPRPAVNPGAFDNYSYLLSNDTWGGFNCDSIVVCSEGRGFWNALSRYARTTVYKAALSIRNSDYRAIIVASFLNDRSDLTESMKGIFFRAGIYHLLALSGFNLAIVSAALFAALFLVPIPKGGKVGIVLVCVWSYLLFIGPIPSLFRAVVMTSVVLVSFLFQRRPRMLNSLGIAGIGWLLFSPLSLFEPGYQLSFCATAAIGALYPVLIRLWNDSGRFPLKKVLSPLASPLFISVAAFLSTAPIIAYHFGTLSMSGIIVNLFAITLMSVSMWISMAGFLLQVFLPAAVPLVMAAAELCIDVMIRSAGSISSLQFSTVALPKLLPGVYVSYAWFLVGLCAVKQGFVRRYMMVAGGFLLTVSTVLVLWQMNHSPGQMVLFSVKKAHLTAVRWPNRSIWIIGFDGKGISKSTYSRIIQPWLRQSPGSTVNAIFLTEDPCNAIQSVEPVLSDNHVHVVLSVDSFASVCPDFLSFAREYGACCTTVHAPRLLVAAPSCTLSIMPGGVDSIFPERNRVSVNISGTSVSCTDSVLAPSDIKGATIVTFGKASPPRVESAVPSWHPLAAAMQ